jgi:acyl-CoA thioester hydrolase
MTAPDVFEFSLQVRYMEVDAQSVVFNAWYLTYFDEAFSAFLTDRGLPYEKMIESGFDVQLVHTEIDWLAGLRWQDQVRVAVATARVGTTSFALDFQTRRDGTPTCTARTVYVVIATDGSGKRSIPPLLADALGPPAPLRPAG